MFDLLVSDALRIAHLLAVAVGFGVAAETEVYMARRRRTTISPGLLSGLEHRHRVILFALGGMWVTGLALVALRTGFQLSAFTPKLWGKLTVVTILSVNAVFVARFALPVLAGHKGGRIGALPAPERRALYSVAGVSGASWLVALALGASAALKAAPAPVFQLGLPLAYVAGILGANLVGARLFARGTASRGTLRGPSLHRGRADDPRHAKQDNETPALQRAVAHRIPAHEATRASDLAIAFPARPGRGPRLKPGPSPTPDTRAARARLADIAGDIGAPG